MAAWNRIMIADLAMAAWTVALLRALRCFLATLAGTNAVRIHTQFMDVSAWPTYGSVVAWSAALTGSFSSTHGLVFWFKALRALACIRLLRRVDVPGVASKSGRMAAAEPVEVTAD